ncbi:hypothetical protein GCM10027416_04510 [Okibacterium endophyticum]
MTIKTRTRWIVGLTLGAALLAGTATTGYAIGAASNLQAQRAYATGIETARWDYCNLQFDDDHKPVADDPRTYAGLPDSAIVADASCSPELVTSWNNAQQDAGADERGCVIDDNLTAIIGAYVCTVPTSTTY